MTKKLQPKPDDYHYTACGLDNVIVRGLKPVTDDAGKTVNRIPRINLLHKSIAQAIVELPFSMNGKELRFLRTEMGMTQAELAEIVHREPLAISRWEREENEIDNNAEIVIRLLARDRLKLKTETEVQDLSRRVVSRTSSGPIEIDGSNPKNYRPIAA